MTDDKKYPRVDAADIKPGDDLGEGAMIEMRPWIIVHEVDHDDGTTAKQILLAGRENATAEDFVLCIAGIVRALAKHTGLDESLICEMVSIEIDEPTEGFEGAAPRAKQ